MYDVILADPPWRQRKGGKRSVRPRQGRELDYTVLSLFDIGVILQKAMRLGNNDHSFFLWTIDKYLHEAELMMRSNGYKLHARFIWNKRNGVAPAFTVRFGHEYLLWFYKEKLLTIDSAERGKILTVFEERSRKHSQKPEISYQIIERLYPDAKRLEMFARQPREGWDVWGNEVENTIDL